MTSVLIIDDCEDFRESVLEILADEGFTVEVADGPETALACCAARRFDLILCDIVLPDQEDEFAGEDSESASAIVGVHTIRQLTKQYPEIPVVAVSGALTGAPLEAIQSFGAIRCLSKPFGRDDLLGAVHAVLGQ